MVNTSLPIYTGGKEAARVVIDEAHVEGDEVARRVRHLAGLDVDIADNGRQGVVKAKRHRAATSYNTIQYNTIQYNTIQYNTIRYDTIIYDTIQCNTIQCDAMRYDAMRCDAMRYDTIQCIVIY